jgi:hypothetical protein
MELTPVQEAGTWLEKANANLDPDLLSIETVREEFAVYARPERLVAYGKTMLARKLDDAAEVARTTGVSVGKAKVTVDTGKALSDAMEVCDAFKSGDISADQASEIARAEQAEPGSAPSCSRSPNARASRSCASAVTHATAPKTERDRKAGKLGRSEAAVRTEARRPKPERGPPGR